MIEANKNVIRRYIETWNRSDLDTLVRFWAPNLIHHTRLGAHNYEETRRIVGAIMHSFPDMCFVIEDMVAEGDKVVTRLTWRGTHCSEYMGALPTGRQICCALIGIARL